ncbi:MAG TPA: beta-ketoacyl-[acyl-carrier-protein] synthase family protein [Gemmatimonadaceae bacterium]|nr:beta-ketoacyl-[acyl-carrier-protein] synthase family protein [Gemmatimonadaceae bacterium]
MRRVVVTGIGVLSPLGNDKDSFFAGLVAGRSGIRRMPPADGLTATLAAPLEFDGALFLPRRQAEALDRTTQIALVAARQAIADAALVVEDAHKHRAGVYWGTGMGSAHTIEELCGATLTDRQSRVHPNTVVKIMSNAAAAQLSMDFGLRGPSLTFSTACSSSAVSIGEAFRSIRYGVIDSALAGGAESLLTYCTMRSWEALKILALEDSVDPAASCRPFSMDRTGFVLGEGSAALVLEEAGRARERGAHVYAEIVGYGCTTDASHLTKPDATGEARAMQQALLEAELGPQDIGYINAHGTATPVGDVVETEAIKSVFGRQAKHVPISSTKSMHGHLMGATGATEFAAALLAMKHGVAPPTAHLRTADPNCDLDYVPNHARENLRIEAVMSNSFAFGGNNAVLVAKAWKE